MCRNSLPHSRVACLRLSGFIQPSVFISRLESIQSTSAHKRECEQIITTMVMN